MLNLGFFHWSLHWEMSTRLLEKEDFFVIVTDVTMRTGKWSVDWDRRLGEKLQWILTLIKPKDIHQWSWHTSEPWNGCSAYVSIISLMGLFFFFCIDTDFLLKFIPLLEKSLNMYSWKKIYEKKSPVPKFYIPM